MLSTRKDKMANGNCRETFEHEYFLIVGRYTSLSKIINMKMFKVAVGLTIIMTNND